MFPLFKQPQTRLSATCRIHPDSLQKWHFFPFCHELLFHSLFPGWQWDWLTKKKCCLCCSLFVKSFESPGLTLRCSMFKSSQWLAVEDLINHRTPTGMTLVASQIVFFQLNPQFYPGSHSVNSANVFEAADLIEREESSSADYPIVCCQSWGPQPIFTPHKDFKATLRSSSCIKSFSKSTLWLVDSEGGRMATFSWTQRGWLACYRTLQLWSPAQHPAHESTSYIIL